VILKAPEQGKKFYEEINGGGELRNKRGRRRSKEPNQKQLGRRGGWGNLL